MYRLWDKNLLDFTPFTTWGEKKLAVTKARGWLYFLLILSSICINSVVLEVC